MAWRVAVLGTEGGAKGIDFGKVQGEYLGLHLAAHGEVRRPSEKVLPPVHVAVIGPGNVS